MYIFSSNAAPLEDGRPYAKFAAYAAFNHDGDFNAAASALRRQGFGGETDMNSPKCAGRWDHLRDLLSKRPPSPSR